MTNRYFLLLIVTGVICISSGSGLASIGPFEISNADSSSKIRLQFVGQLRTILESRDQGANRDRQNTGRTEARRVRLVLSGSILKPNLSYKLHLSAAPGSSELMDFYFDYRIADRMQIRCGQYKVPFTRYRIQSFQQLTFADWSIVSTYFGAERQMGISLHNGYEQPAEFSYVVGLFTGVNARASHAVGLSKLSGMALSNPSDLSEPGSNAGIHPELFLHASYNANGIKVQSDSDEERGGFRYSAGVSAAWDLNPVSKKDLAGRIAPEVLMKYRGASAACVGYAAFGGISDPSSSELVLLGGLFQSAYRFVRNWEVSARYSVVDVRSSLIDELLEEKPISADAQVRREHEITLGVNIYVMGHNLKIQNDLTWLRHSYISKSLDDFVARSQCQLAL
ncbi:MAG: OprO/OprP family phosphate-selective porin [candidate division Zixibacteria bacterium]|nr:OprO/OprP family phosphate-selective porin [candidate division Zixibacteria bacterium]MBU1469908.1 OprO/OprP family phosphate-selective porin [candidate division Zixibacteria bacterium]MBU2624003.1 OprO/OprP family phosphate-selective porin [candidate division Zixibacteria bacterium]